MASPMEWEVDWTSSSLEKGEERELHFDLLGDS
jgi:hypothetical protein